MDDRDFIYWINGMFEFKDIDILRSSQIEQIIENIMEVHEFIRDNGFFNDLDAFRVISLIEGSLLYYEEASIEHKIKTTNLIKNEVDEVIFSLKNEDAKDRTPFKSLPSIYELEDAEKKRRAAEDMPDFFALIGGAPLVETPVPSEEKVEDEKMRKKLISEVETYFSKMFAKSDTEEAQPEEPTNEYSQKIWDKKTLPLKGIVEKEEPSSDQMDLAGIEFKTEDVEAPATAPTPTPQVSLDSIIGEKIAVATR